MEKKGNESMFVTKCACECAIIRTMSFWASDGSQCQVALAGRVIKGLWGAEKVLIQLEHSERTTPSKSPLDSSDLVGTFAILQPLCEQ